jgi:hypothetical protein
LRWKLLRTLRCVFLGIHRGLRSRSRTVGVLLGAMFVIAGLQQFFIALFAGHVARWMLIDFGLLPVVAEAFRANCTNSG